MRTKNTDRPAKEGKKKDGAFPSKQIKHDPQAESARTKFGLNGSSDGDRKAHS